MSENETFGIYENLLIISQRSSRANASQSGPTFPAPIYFVASIVLTFLLFRSQIDIQNLIVYRRKRLLPMVRTWVSSELRGHS